MGVTRLYLPTMRRLATSQSILIGIVSATIGCVAAYPQHHIAEVKEFPVATGSKPSVKITFEEEQRQNSNLVMTEHETRTEKFREIMIEVLRNSGYFSEVNTYIDSPDLEIIANLSADFKVNHAWVYVTVCTAFLVPSVFDKDFALDAVVRTSNRAQTWELNYRDSMQSWAQLFLIVMMPFHEESAVEREVVENMFRRLAFDLNDRGILAAVE